MVLPVAGRVIVVVAGRVTVVVAGRVVVECVLVAVGRTFEPLTEGRVAVGRVFVVPDTAGLTTACSANLLPALSISCEGLGLVDNGLLTVVFELLATFDAGLTFEAGLLPILPVILVAVPLEPLLAGRIVLTPDCSLSYLSAKLLRP